MAGGGDSSTANLAVIVNSNFRSPNIREIHELSRCIQRSDNEKVKEIIWRNPKILVTEVDTPILLHEGCRYNALHICAKHGNAEAAKIILQAISSTEMMNMLYPHDDEDNKCIRVNYLVDLYLNTPDAIIHETPLHFATKFGYPRVCEVLMQHPKVQLDVLNKDEETPTSVICRRVSDSDPTKDARFLEINRMFLAVFIVPIWRELDGSNGFIGKPVQPKQLGPKFCPPTLMPYFHSIDPRLFDEIDKTAIPTGLDGHPMKVSAYVGPMTAKEANTFLSLMKKSSRAAHSYYTSHTIPCSVPMQSCADCDKTLASIFATGDTMPEPKIVQAESALEILTNSSNGKGDANQEISDPAEDIVEGLGERCKTRLDSLITSIEKMILEEGAGKKSIRDLQSSMEVLKGARMVSKFPKPSVKSIREAAMRMEDPLTGLERVARLRAKEMAIPMKQQWTFLNTFVDVTTDEGLRAIEEHLEALEQRQEFCLSDIVADDSMLDICEKILNLRLTDDSPEKPLPDAENSRRNSAGRASNGSSDEFEDCETKDVFIHGDYPTMDDWFLQKAVQDTLESILDSERNMKYPYMSRWYDKLKSFGNASRRGWAAVKPMRKK